MFQSFSKQFRRIARKQNFVFEKANRVVWLRDLIIFITKELVQQTNKIRQFNFQHIYLLLLISYQSIRNVTPVMSSLSVLFTKSKLISVH